MRPVENPPNSVNPPPEDDPVFESLLAESLGGPAPPDQTDKILQRIEAISSRAPVTRVALESNAVPAKTSHRHRLLVSSALLAVAAGLAWIVMSRLPLPQPGPDEAKVAAGLDKPATGAPDRALETDPVRGDSRLATTSPTESDDDLESTPDARSREASRDPILLEMNRVPFGKDDALVKDASRVPATPQMPPPRERLTDQQIVERIDAQLAAAWADLSLQQAEPADAAEVAKRFQRVIATQVPAADFARPERLVGYVGNTPARNAIADALVDKLLGPLAAPRLNDGQRQALTGWIATSLTGKIGFDEVITGLYFGGAGKRAAAASQTWLTALAGGQSIPLTEQTGHALLDLDLRCGRCHDHPIESGIGQQDYWQFAALFENGLYYTRSENGKPEVHQRELKLNPAEGVFFELPDGRQRVALPRVSTAWLGLSGDESVEQLSQLSDYWIDNPQLARSTINRLWEVVYGRPLVGAGSDPDAPPRNEHLTELRDFLAEQLRAHDFDLAEASSWLLAAAPMRLSTPSSLAGPRQLTASRQEQLQADVQTRVFAAYRPTERQQSFAGLVAMANGWNGGGTLDAPASGPTLAQPVDVGSQNPRQRSAAENRDRFRRQGLRASFPTISEVSSEPPDLPAQWLASLKTFEQQARHLYYAAGYWRPSRSQLRAADSLYQSTEDADLALSQLWWAIQKSTR